MTAHYAEKTGATVGFAIFDAAGVALTPTSLEYRIDCLTTGAEIKDDTALSAASTGGISILPADTTLESQDNATELRVMTVTADKTLDTQHIEQFQYTVSNLTAVI